jgi:ligand-binding sensor domain-containing protein
MLGAIWIGTEDGGVSKFDGVSWKTYTQADGLPSNEIRSIVADSHGIVWISTSGDGVSKFDGASWNTVTDIGGIPSREIIEITVDRHGVVWFGAWGGVVKLDGVSWTRYTLPDGLPSGGVSTIYQDSRDVYWFGMWDGVSRFDGKTWKTYTTRNGLAGNTVYTFAEDAGGTRWFGTWSGGISKLEEELPSSVSDSINRNRPTLFGIRSAYPNPFNPATTIEFSLPRPGKAKLSIYSISGQLINILSDGEMSAGNHRVVWNAARRASGVYLAILESEGKRDIRKVALVR